MKLNPKLIRAMPVLAVMAVWTLTACSHDPPAYQRPVRTYKKEPTKAAVANMQLAIEYMRLGQLSNSRERIERALSEDSSNADVQMTAGLVYERINEMAKAERAYDAANRLGKGDPNIANTYAVFLCRTGKTAAGQKLFQEVAVNPLYQTPWVALGNAGSCVRAAPATWTVPKNISIVRSRFCRTTARACCNWATSRSIGAMRQRRSTSCSATWR